MDFDGLRAAALFALAAAPAGATCVVAVWTPERVVIGADSKETFIRPDHAESSFTECKIRAIGAYYAVVAGVTEHRPSDFDIWEILRTSIGGTKSVPMAAEAAAAGIARGYAKVLRTAGEKNGPQYLASLESNAPQFMIAGISNGRPYLARYSYDRVRGGGWVWRKQVYPGAGDSPGYLYLCDPRGITNYQRRHPRWRSDDPVKTAAGMIAAAAAIGSDVGPPIAVLVLDAGGAHWQDPGTCR